MRRPRHIAMFDSATTMLRALARFLHGRDLPAAGMHPALWPVMTGANLLPVGVREALYRFGGWAEAIPPAKLSRASIESIHRWAVGQYPRRRYPAVAVGASNGAAVHLCAALGVPWLPQTFLIPVRRRAVHPDDFATSLEWARQPARRLLAANPDLQLHHMHDPNQDRQMIRRMTYFRVKRRRLGAAYERFLVDARPPGGTILVVDCERRWPATVVEERHVFQPGAMGGAEPDEYLRGGPRVREFLRRQHSPVPDWRSPEPNGEWPEAEWGFEPALLEDVERLARERGYRVRRLSFREPEHLSPLVADLHRWWYSRLGRPTGTLLVESFFLLEPFWALRTASVPFWTKFAVEPDAEWLERYLERGEPFEEIRMTLFSHGTESLGLAGVDPWRAIVRRAQRRGGFVGVDHEAFPRDFAVFVRFHRELRRPGRQFRLPSPLTLADLDAFFGQHAGRYLVRLSDLSAAA